MKLKELLAKRAALLGEVEAADEKRFAEIKAEIEKLDYQIEREQRAAATANEAAEKERLEAEQRAVRPPAKPGDKPGQAEIFRLAFGGGKGAENATEPMTKDERLRYAKSALGKELRSQLTKMPVNYTEGEKRALGIALTTTATNYTAPTEAADGINNGGVFIGNNVLYDLLQIDELDSPFMRDCLPTNITGALIFPYVEEKTLPAADKRGKKEKAAAADLSVKWGKMTLPLGNYPLTVEVTMELLNMTDDAFAQYILDELHNEINLLLGEEVFYGSGTNDRIKGVCTGAIKKTYNDAAESFKEAFNALSKRFQKNAKLYLSRALSLDLAFEKDADGRYMYPVYNAGGIETIAKVPVEVDDGLAAGDYLYGCARNMKINFPHPTEIYSELHGKTRVIEATAHVMVAAAPTPNAFVHGTKATQTPAPANNGVQADETV